MKKTLLSLGIILSITLVVLTLSQYQRSIRIISNVSKWNDDSITNLKNKEKNYQDLLISATDPSSKKMINGEITKLQNFFQRMESIKKDIPSLRKKSSYLLLSSFVLFAALIILLGLYVYFYQDRITSFLNGINDKSLSQFLQKKYEYPLILTNKQNKIIFANDRARKITEFKMQQNIFDLLDRGMDNLVAINGVGYQVVVDKITDSINGITFIQNNLAYKLELNLLVENLLERLSRICQLKKVVLDLHLNDEINLAYDIEIPMYHIMLQLINYASIFFQGQKIELFTRKENYPVIDAKVNLKGSINQDKFLRGVQNNLKLPGLDIKVVAQNDFLVFTFSFLPKTKLLNDDQNINRSVA